MPVIVLNHVTKRFGTHEAEPGSLSRMVSTSTRLLFSSDSSKHFDPSQSSVAEPPDRENALDDLSLTLHDGETTSILGPSGCGKTTLLKVIAGLIKPDSGAVYYDGQPVASIPTTERGIGMVFQSYALYPHLPAYDNIGFYDIIRRQPEKIPERIRHIVDVMGVEIKHLLGRKPPTLSGGEQQRIAIARCLARDPKVFLFDEPLSNLDAKLRVDTRVQIKRLLQAYRITSVYVTHDQTEAIALADRIAIMRAGKIEQVGTAQALYNTPRNAFVAQFFGTPPMNLFPGHVFGDTWEGRGFSISPIRPALQQGQALWLGIRPEHIRLTPDAISARVEYVEPILTQHRQLIYLRLGSQQCTVSAPVEIDIKPNTLLSIEFPPEHLYLFDQKTGARVG